MYQGPALRQLNQPVPMLIAEFSANSDPERASIGIGTWPTVEPDNPPAAVTNPTKLKTDGSRGPTVKDRWEARWRAAGAELKARAERIKPGGEAKRPDYGTRYDSVPLKEPRVARATSGTVEVRRHDSTDSRGHRRQDRADWINPVLEPHVSASPAQESPTAEIAPRRPVGRANTTPVRSRRFRESPRTGVSLAPLMMGCGLRRPPIRYSTIPPSQTHQSSRLTKSRRPKSSDE